MAYDEQLADRVRAVLATRRGVSEKRMFGGLTFSSMDTPAAESWETSSWFAWGLSPTLPRSRNATPARWTSQVDRSGATYTSREKVSGQIKQCDRGSSGE